MRRTIETGRKGSGYIFSSCNSLINSIPVENVKAMIEEAGKY